MALIARSIEQFYSGDTSSVISPSSTKKYYSHAYTAIRLVDDISLNYVDTVNLFCEFECTYSPATQKWSILKNKFGINKETAGSTGVFSIRDEIVGAVKNYNLSNLQVSNHTKLYDSSNILVLSSGESSTQVDAGSNINVVLPQNLTRYQTLLWSPDGSEWTSLTIPGQTIVLGSLKDNVTVKYSWGDYTNTSGTKTPTEVKDTAGLGKQTAIISPRIKRAQSKTTKKYNLTWKNDGSTLSTTTSNPEETTTTFSDFNWVSGRDVVPSGGTIEISTAGTYTYTASSASDSVISKYATIGQLQQTPSLFGFKNLKWYVNDEVVRSTTQITSDTIINLGKEPVVYKIKFDISKQNNELWPEGSNILATVTKPYSINMIDDSAYGDNTTVGQLYINEPTKFGYRFVGWHYNNSINPTDNSVIKSSDKLSKFDDLIHTFINSTYDRDTLVSTDTLVLKALWVPIVHKIECHFGNKVSNVEYTIEGVHNNTDIDVSFTNGLANVFSPKNMPIADSAFFGWAQDVTYVNNKYVYDSPLEKLGSNISLIYECHLPFTVDTTKITEWKDNEVTHKIYGYWLKSGKYIKTESGWKKVSVAYVKILDNGIAKWVPITDKLKVKTHSGWKQEV